MLEDALTNEWLDLIAAHEEGCVALQVHHAGVRYQLACTPPPVTTPSAEKLDL